MAVITDVETREIVRSYHDAWVSGEVDAAGQYLADEILNRAPFNNHATAPVSRGEYLDGLRRFRQSVTGVETTGELYGDGEATLVYDAHTSARGTFHTAEHFRLTDGLISSVDLIFYVTPPAA
jgi:hypothetical protein